MSGNGKAEALARIREHLPTAIRDELKQWLAPVTYDLIPLDISQQSLPQVLAKIRSTVPGLAGQAIDAFLQNNRDIGETVTKDEVLDEMRHFIAGETETICYIANQAARSDADEDHECYQDFD